MKTTLFALALVLTSATSFAAAEPSKAPVPAAAEQGTVDQNAPAPAGSEGTTPSSTHTAR